MDDCAVCLGFNSKSMAAFNKPESLHNLKYYKMMANTLTKPYRTQS